MAGVTTTTVLDGESSGMERAYKTGNKLVEELIRTVASMTPAYQNADKAADSLMKRNVELERAANRLRGSLVTPQSEYKAAIDLANQALQAELISEGEYAMAVDKAKHALESQDGTLKKVEQDTAKVAAAQNTLIAIGNKIRSALVTPQSEYRAALDLANQALQAEVISEGEYAMAVEQATKDLNSKDVALQKTITTAQRIRTAAVTPEQSHAQAIAAARQALDRKLITQREYDSELRTQNELLKKAKSAQLDLGQASTSVMGQFATELTGMGSLFAGVGGTVALLRTEIQEFREAQKTSADKQLEVAPMQRAAILNLGDDPTMSPEQLNVRADALSKQRKLPLAKVYDILSNTLSSRGALTSEDAIKAADVAAEASPYAGTTEIAGSVLDMQNRYGGSAEQMMGINLGTQQASRVKDTASFAKNVVPTIVQLGGFGDSVEESSRLVAALSTAMNDLEGRQSSTAAEQLAKQLAIALPDQKNTTERFKFLQTEAGAKDRTKLFGDGKGKKGTLSFESGAYVAMNELVASGDNQTKRAYQAAAAAIPTLEKAETYYRDTIGRVNRQTLQLQSEFDRTIKIAAEQGSVNNLEGARASMAREGLDTALKQSGDGFVSRFITARQMDVAEFTGSATPSEFATQTLEKKASRLRAGKNYEGNIIGPTAEELKIADSLSSLSQAMGKLTATLQADAAKLEANTDATKDNTKKVKAKPISQPAKRLASEALGAK
jgi:hypothetical protein